MAHAATLATAMPPLEATVRAERGALLQRIRKFFGSALRWGDSGGGGGGDVTKRLAELDHLLAEVDALRRRAEAAEAASASAQSKLSMLRADNASGYRGVYQRGERFHAKIRQGDRENKYGVNDLKARRLVWLDLSSLASATGSSPVLVVATDPVVAAAAS